MTAERQVLASASMDIGGITFTAEYSFSAEFHSVEEVNTAYDVSLRVVGAAIDRARLKYGVAGTIPSGARSADKGTASANNESAGMKGTEFIPILHVKIGLDENGGRLVRLCGGRFAKWGVRLWPERYNLVAGKFGAPDDLENCNLGAYRLKGAQMVVTIDDQKHVIVNDVRELVK